MATYWGVLPFGVLSFDGLLCVYNGEKGECNSNSAAATSIDHWLEN